MKEEAEEMGTGYVSREQKAAQTRSKNSAKSSVGQNGDFGMRLWTSAKSRVR
jgi:hypothetical protein